MEKQIFELFMRLRFPLINSSQMYYDEWKERFEGNPIRFMDSESLEAFRDVLNVLYLNSIRRILRSDK